ncbi:MAG: hypothetical protein H0V17_15925, partial [Deltaproteobacteria bacterium]|nr:hypothetical protein [Deltaproteobacteria bacterium]
MGSTELLAWQAAPGSRVGDYILEAELPARPGERIFASTHRLLPRRAHIVLPEPERAFELACVLEQISHPAVPRIYECGQLEDKNLWLAVSVIDGPTLAERLAHHALAVPEVVAMVRDLAAILAHAHELGIVHGDLRTERVASTANGWRIVDWSEAGHVKDQLPG